MLDLILLSPIYLLSFLFVFSIIVIFHELGHFWVARACGVRVDSFSIGFGRTLMSRTDKRGTVWRVAALPFGGYVKFFGDASAASNPDVDRLSQMKADIAREHGEEAVASCFHFKPLWQRAAVVAAGPAANFLLAFAIFTAMTLAFGERGVPAQVSAVVEGSPAAEAGFEPGDVILEADGRDIRLFSDLVQYIALSSNETVSFVVERGGDQITLDAEILRAPREDAFGNPVRVGFLGVSADPAEVGTVFERHGVLGAAARGGVLTWQAVEAPARYITRVVLQKESADQFRGPLGIGQLSGDAARQSFEAGAAAGGVAGGMLNSLVTLLTLAAILSTVMGLLNLMPIPILDGGHLLYYGYEAVRGRPLGEGAQEWGFHIGLALVLGLMLFATWNDLRFGIFQSLSNVFS